MIGSRQATIIFAALAGLASSFPSVMLGGSAVIAGAHSPDPPLSRILILFLLPVVMFVAPVALLSRKHNRLLAVGVGLGATVAGYALLFVRLKVVESMLMQEVEYVNATGEPVMIYWAREGESLSRSTPLDPGEVRKRGTPIYAQGHWLRLVAIRPRGLPGSKEYDESLPWTLWPSDEDRLAERKLFDQTFTWDVLRSMGGRVVITSGARSP